ncbi:hypothetical protein D3C73_1429490 [compost metagenome]
MERAGARLGSTGLSSDADRGLRLDLGMEIAVIGAAPPWSTATAVSANMLTSGVKVGSDFSFCSKFR